MLNRLPETVIKNGHVVRLEVACDAKQGVPTVKAQTHFARDEIKRSHTPTGY